MKKLFLPCLKGYMGDWFYYTCIMKISDVAERVNYAKEIHTNTKLSDLIQRTLEEGRGKKIKNYLLTNEERFFNSMIVAVYDGDPEWYEIGNLTTEIEGVEIGSIPENVIDTIGILKFSGKERFFALDGQHRLSGIKQALNEKPELGNEEISVIFVAHKKDNIGLQRSRRLFTTLNKTAKPVAKREIITLDEDDTMAILTRRLIEENNLFSKDRISYQKGNNIPLKNKTSLTTIENLYEILDYLLKHVLYNKKNDDLKLNRLPEDTLDEIYKKICEFMTIMFDTISPLKDFSTKNYANAITKYRHESGGSIFYRPIGLTITMMVLKKLCTKYKWKEAINMIARLPHDLNETPYRSIVWNPTKNTIITTGKTLTVKMLLYMLDEYKNENGLLLEYKKSLGEGSELALLPSKVI